MSITFEIAGVDVSSTVRYREWALVECAERGQVGAGTVVIDDTTGSYVPPAQKAITVEESTASPVRMFTGYVAERSGKKGPLGPGQRQWSVTVEDLNVLLDDRIITDAMGGKRPQEDDKTRIDWLLGIGAAGPISAGVVPNTNLATLDKADYRGRRMRDVLEDAAQKSGKTYFVYRFASGPLLYYDLPNNTALTSTVSISDDHTAVDNATVFGPYNVTYSLDPARVYSRVRVRYKGGSATVDNATTASTFRTREVYKRWMRVKTAARASEQATKWLEQADDETRQITLSVLMPAAYVNEIRAGMRVSITLSRYGFSGVFWRVTKRTVRQKTDSLYEVELTFAEKIRSTAFDSGPDIAVDEEMSNATEDVATAVIDESGLTITGGTISVTNGAGVVIIDGTTDFWSINATGTIALPRNEARGSVKASVLLATGLANDPVTLFTAKRPGEDGTGDWVALCPQFWVSNSGTITNMLHGRARAETLATGALGTRVQGLKFTSTPPFAARPVRYWVMEKDAI